jgi:hypothetical protein
MPYARRAEFRTGPGVVILWLREFVPRGRGYVCAANLVPITFTLDLAGTESEPRTLVVKERGFDDLRYQLDAADR